MYGVQRDPDQVSRSFSHHWKLMNLKHPNYGRNTGVSSHEWWKELVRRTFVTDSVDLAKNKLDSISDHLYNLYKSNVCWKVEPGAEILLKHLKQKHIVLGVISNFDERLDSVLKSNGLKSYFDFVLASYLVETAKPSKKIFDLALYQTGCVTASQALHIGDNVKLDYIAAKEAGWNALLFKRPHVDRESLKLVDSNDIVCDTKEIEKFVLYS
ncbi:rhythmically expressed gene 2 protein [Trichonephila clavipes]|nr:rhythmically expressed gene 2 protein [Trichonephila clavipes]